MTAKRQKLTLVFALEPVSRAQVKTGKDDIVFFSSGNVELGESILYRLMNVWPGWSTAEVMVRNDGKVISLESLLLNLRKGLGWGGPIQFSNMRLQVAELPAMEQLIIQIEELEPQSAGAWETWALALVNDLRFVQAWISDVAYDYWQNASDPLEYEAVGRDYSNLPMISNCLPFPLEQSVIDTSKNPARVEINRGYVEAIGAKMWLGDALFTRLSIRKEDLMSLSDVRVIKCYDNVVCVSAGDQPFDSEETINVQKRLRRALYGRS